MDYFEFYATFVTRVSAALTGLRNSLVAAGVNANAVTVEQVEQEGVNDLRWRITVTRGPRTFICYVELTAAGIIDGAMAIVLTMWVEGNGGQIVTSYSSGAPVRYDQATEIEKLLVKLENVESVVAGELVTAARAFLRV